MVPKTNRQLKALETKNKLIDSALKVFATKGFAASTTKDIAKEAGVTDGLIYHYFASKEQLMSAILEKHTLNHELKNTANKFQKDMPLEDILQQYFSFLLKLLHEKSELIVMCFGEAQRNPEIRERLSEIIQEGLAPLFQIIIERTKCDPEFLAVAVRNVQVSVVMYFLMHDRIRNDAEERERYIALTTKQFIKAIS